MDPAISEYIDFLNKPFPTLTTPQVNKYSRSYACTSVYTFLCYIQDVTLILLEEISDDVALERILFCFEVLNGKELNHLCENDKLCDYSRKIEPVATKRYTDDVAKFIKEAERLTKNFHKFLSKTLCKRRELIANLETLRSALLTTLQFYLLRN